jgi:hypothetical protein
MKFLVLLWSVLGLPYECHWQRGHTIWKVPSGYAIYLSSVGDEYPAITDFAFSYEDAQKFIRRVFKEDMKRGLVRCHRSGTEV